MNFKFLTGKKSECKIFMDGVEFYDLKQK